MTELLASILVFALVIAGLGLGLLCGRRGVQGSCGGLGNIPGIRSDCNGACRHPCERRRRQNTQAND
ncbi:MAG: (Na+)-NQR maturation NqrM [Thiohalobacterales bacterium]|nr:(Na+)-NQR maturation NqrM [Thiohalobacterales bacterium]